MKSLTITKTNCLNEKQLLELQQLAALCEKHDGCSISCPTFPEDHAEYILLYENEACNQTAALVSALALVCYDADTAECCAFTRPDCRRQGYFSKLLDGAMERLEDCDILFPVSGNCPDTLAVLQTLGAELDSCEMQMKLDLEAVSYQIPALNQQKFGFLLQKNCSDSPFASQTEWIFYENNSCRKQLGSCQTTLVSEACVCLHHVEILTEFRNQGYGTRFMEHLIFSLKEQGINQILLQVSGDNAAALALYKRQGFRITETLSFYLY